jgi:hypothetical protein
VLALSVFVMHTLGHPDSPSDEMSTTSHSPTVAVVAGPPIHEAGSDTAVMDDHGSPSMRAEHSPSAHVPLMAMDMLSLCLAVLLGAWILAALLRSALARRPDWLTHFLAMGPVLLRPNPPPRGPDLTQLSVLRL